jgi:signal peptidase I
MSPTFQNGDAALMQHIYDTSQLSYNDVIVIKSNKVNQTIVKRIIGLPGDTVQIINQSVFVNNVLYSEASTFDPIIDSGNASAPIHLSDHEFFVLGDNRNASIDSRFDTIGLIPESSIIGKIIWSFL